MNNDDKVSMKVETRLAQ